MKKTLVLFAFVSLLCSQAFAYVIVLKDGTRYNAKSKWTIVNGKATFTLESGGVVNMDPNAIDVAKTDEVNKLGLGNVNVLGTEPQSQTNTQKQAPSLGTLVKMRKQPGQEQPAPKPAPSPVGTAPAAPPPVPDQLDPRLKDTFERAYENVGIFEHKLTGTNRDIRVELTADSEDKVFNAISATAFLIVRNAGLEAAQIDLVELYMRTTTGGSAGRFMINRADADTINEKLMTLQDYFVRKVIY
ncbi:MAG TPA: hypothetical protein VF980_10860 [Thermoanaerobaculia bacterium]